MSSNYLHYENAVPTEFISIIGANQCARIRINDIEMIEQDGRRLHIVTAEKDYSFYGSLNSIAVILADRAFYRVMKSVIINFDHVRDISGISVSFNSGQSITLGRNSLNKTRRAYKRYLMKYPPYSLWDPTQLTSMSVYEGEEGDEKNSSKNTQKVQK